MLLLIWVTTRMHVRIYLIKHSIMVITCMENEQMKYLELESSEHMQFKLTSSDVHMK